MFVSEPLANGFLSFPRFRLVCLLPLSQMKAPWQAMSSHHYDEELVLSVPPEVSNPPPGKTAGRDQVGVRDIGMAYHVLVRLYCLEQEEAKLTAGVGAQGTGGFGQKEIAFKGWWCYCCFYCCIFLAGNTRTRAGAVAFRVVFFVS